MARKQLPTRCVPVENLPDGPVPGLSQSGVCGEQVCEPPHALECKAQRALLDLKNISFDSLQVHRMENGICLTGIVSVKNTRDMPPIERIVRLACGINHVLNHLVVRVEEGAVEVKVEPVAPRILKRK